MAEDKHGEEGFLAGLIVGGVIGAGLALILGGEDKDELRRRLKIRGKAVLKNLEGVVEEGKGKTEEVREQVEEEVGQMKSSHALVRRFFTRGGRKLS